MPTQLKSHCPHCQAVVRVNDSLIGKRVRCPACKTPFELKSAQFAPSSPSLDQSPKATETIAPASSDTSRAPDLFPPPANANQPSAQSRLGRFELKELLGQGAFGRVYKAYDPQLDREVALKVPIFGAEDQHKIDRFITEAKSAARLRHSNIVTIHDIGRIDSRPYIVAHFVRGQSLAKYIEENPPDFRQAAEWVRQLADALAYAHSEGVIHRDIKPANIMLDEKGVPQIMDFGLAKRLQDDSTRTADGSILGTPAYMSPEQVKGKQADIGPASDQYSLGVVLYELLTGKRPFEGPSHSVMAQITNSEPPSPRSLRADIPSHLEAICLRALAKQPENRYANMAAVRDVLAAFLSLTAISQLASLKPNKRLVRNADPSPHWLLRIPRSLWIAVTSAVAAVLFAAVFFIRTPVGTLRIEVNDPQIEVLVDGAQMTFIDKQAEQLVAAGEHRLALRVKDKTVPLSARPTVELDGHKRELVVQLDGAKLTGSEFNLVKGQTTAVTIRLLPPENGHAESMPARPAPTKEELAALAEIRSQHGEILAFGTSKQKSDLADDLLRTATNDREPSPKRLAALKVASSLLFEVGSFDKPLETCDAVAKSLGVTDVLDLKTELLSQSAAKAMENHAVALTENALRLGFRCFAIDRYRPAQELADTAIRAAKRSRREDLVYQSDFLKDECDRSSVEYARVKNFEERLEINPADLAANLELGKFYCLIKNDWAKGLPMIVRAKDAQLSPIAARDLEFLEQEAAKKQVAAESQIEHADRWWDVSAPWIALHQQQGRQRAKYWYLKAIGQSDLEQRRNMPQRIVTRIDGLPSRQISLRVRVEGVEGGHALRLSNSGITVTYNGHGTRAVKINHLQLGGQFDHSNSNQFRLFPAVVDFSSIDVRSEWKGRWGQINGYVVRPDYVEIHFEHGPGGSCDFEVALDIDSNGFRPPDRFSEPWAMAFYTFDRTTDSILTADGWSKVVAREAIDRQQLDSINFRFDSEPYTKHRAPSPKMQDIGRVDFYAMVASRDWTVPAGTYEIHVLYDDGIRVFVDGQKVIDDWASGGVRAKTSRVTLAAGSHPVRVEYFEWDSTARLMFSLRRLGDAEQEPMSK